MRIPQAERRIGRAVGHGQLVGDLCQFHVLDRGFQVRPCFQRDTPKFIEGPNPSVKSNGPPMSNRSIGVRSLMSIKSWILDVRRFTTRFHSPIKLDPPPFKAIQIHLSESPALKRRRFTSSSRSQYSRSSLAF